MGGFMNIFRIAIAILIPAASLFYAVSLIPGPGVQAIQGAGAREGGQTSRVIFSSRRSGNQEIYVFDPATRKAINLTNNSADDGYPRISPDGQRIAFGSNRDGYWAIYLMKPDGTQPARLLRERSESGYPDWAPDSRRLVYAATRPGERKNEIYIVGADGSSVRRLTNHPSEDVHPAWSPDGRKIAFASEREGNRRIYVMNADGSGLTCLTGDRWYSDYPAWSPDGSRIAFASDRDSRNSSRLDIYVMNGDGTSLKRITNNGADDRHPGWSPNGKSLVFVSNRFGDRDIFTVNSDGTFTTALFRATGDDEHPQWVGRWVNAIPEAAQTQYPGVSPAEINLRRQIFRQMIADEEIDPKQCAEWGESDPVKLLETERVDLNRDGIAEIKVSGSGCACKGARRCAQWFYRRSGAGYEMLANIYAADNINPMSTSSNGYSDLLVNYPGGNIYPPFHEIYRFDGRRYLDEKEQQEARRRQPANQNSPTRIQPAIPHEDHGACPFECCTYRRWTVTARTIVRQDRYPTSPAAFTLQRGERVTGMTGVVITTQPGLARAVKTTPVGGIQVRPGEIVYLLTNRGEGVYKVWHQGRVEDLAIEGDDVFTLVRRPQYIWWVKVRNSRGQIGWTEQTRNLDGMDACG